MTVEDFVDADHLARLKGQTVHCNKALFVVAGFPSDAASCFKLGFTIGAGISCGAIFAVGVIALVSKLFQTVFA